MPSMPTLQDIVRRRGGVSAPLVEGALRATPELSEFPFASIDGTNYLQPVRTTLPNVGWRAVNQGAPRTKSGYKLVLVNTFIIDASVEVDEEVANEDPRGPHAFIAEEQHGLLLSGFMSAGKQFFYGERAPDVPRAGDGMPGLLNFVDPGMVVPVAGTTGTTSVWVVCASNEQAAPTIHGVFGRGGQFKVSEAKEIVLRDEHGDPFDGYRATFKARLGLHAPKPEQALVRIKGLSDEPGKGLTDELLVNALEKLPTTMRPTHIFLNKRSLRQLRISRFTAAHSPTGEMNRLPTEHDGIKLYCTDSLINGEEAFAA